jgi:class 3 adenylate cyclase/tetratricopeptide (TPR) repeat protein
MACASCSRPLPADAKFCPFCGLEVVSTAGEERRIVTVLFADIVGYTGLVEHLDPERAKRLVDAAFERLIADIVEFGGRVDKVLGDAIIALFGAPVAHEDDADRAIRAALQMHESLAAFVAEQEHDRPIHVRIGVNTGEVLVGRVGGTDDYTAMGDAVNVASRLQALAPPGGVFIGDSTAQLASPEILRERVDDLDVRGREQTETVWRVTGRRRHALGVGVGSDAPFVGRLEQRELLASIMGMVSSGRSAVVAVTGEAGAGKTRLVADALEDFPGADGVVFAGRCAPYGETNVWSPITSALFQRMELDETVSPERLREISRNKGVAHYGFSADDPVLGWFVEAVLHLGGHPSELDDVPPVQARETLFRLIVEGLRRRSHVGPVVVWIDDLHWADSLLIELLHRLARSLVDRPVLIITAQRDDVEIDWPPATDQPITVRMPLDPLSRPEADQLIDAVMGSLPDPVLASQLYERSGGNALFLTELAGLACSDPESTELPSSLRALTAARLDRLTPTARAIIDNAAVLGADGPVDALREYAEYLDQRFTLDDVARLDEDGLLQVDNGWYRFRSDVVREVAYQTLTKLVRAERHAATASVMSGIAGVPIQRVAHHAATAAELIAEIGPVKWISPDIAEQAIDMLREAARRSLDVGAFGHAIRNATRALDLGPDDPATLRDVLLLRARAATERRDVDPAATDARAALESALADGDRRDEGIARRLLGMHAQIVGDLPTSRRELGASVDIFRELGDESELASSLADRGFIEVFGGSLREAEKLLGEAEALADRLGDRRSSAWVSEHQAWVAFLSGDAQLAESRLETAATHFKELGDRSGLGWAHALRAYLYFFARDFDAAEEMAMKVRAEAIELGERWPMAMMDSLVASIRLWSGRFAEAEELSRRSLAGFRELGDRFGIVQALAPRIRALIALGRTHDAERGLEEALSLSDSFGDLAFPTMAAAGAAVHLGLGERSVVIGESALERMTAMGADGGEVRVTLALALCQSGRAEDALTVLLDVQIAFPYAHAVRALASAMVGDGDTALGDAGAVSADPGSTYLDRVIADVAGSTAELRTGDRELAVERLHRARTTARDAGDEVARALADCAAATLVGEIEDGDHDHLGVGWHRVIEELSGVAPHPSSSLAP